MLEENIHKLKMIFFSRFFSYSVGCRLLAFTFTFMHL